jgi:hypothetical protein
MQVEEALAEQARACAELGSPMYAELLGRLVEDVRAGGVCAEVLAGHVDDPGSSALALRLLGSVHRLVLERRAGSLAAYYPSVGGTWEVEAGTASFLRLLAEQTGAVREWLDRPPQTNEVGRAAALLGGLLHLDRSLSRVRLLEIGASGGLNLLPDRFAYVEESGPTTGPAGSPVVLDPAWRGRPLEPWPALEVVERAGCDLQPVDVGTTQGRLVLTAYVWPDQAMRLERLRGALALAARDRPDVRGQGAGDFLAGVDLEEGTTTVVWHSVMWQYLPTEEQARAAALIEALGQRATATAPLAHLSLEPPRQGTQGHHGFPVELTTWPGGVRRVLGHAPPHGLPVTWEEPR